MHFCFAQMLKKTNRVGLVRLTTYMGSIQYFVGLGPND